MKEKLLPGRHPTSADLEVFACDEVDEEIAEHVARCELCRDYVVELVIAAYAARAWEHAAQPVDSWEVS